MSGLFASSNNPNAEQVSNTDLKTAVEKQNDLLDVLVDELYTDELYTQDSVTGGRYDDNDDGNWDNDLIFDDLSGLFTDNITMHKNTISAMTTAGDNLSNTYEHSADMYRNQKRMNKIAENNANKFRKRNKALIDGVENNLRMKQIYTYHYKRKMALVSMLKAVIVSGIVALILTYLNRNFKFLLNDTVYVLGLVILFLAFIVSILSSVFDMVFRNNINYDDYDFSFNVNAASLSDSSNTSTTDTKCSKYSHLIG